MVVYVEYVIIDNMAIDYLLISLSRKTLKLKPNFLLALLSAAVGTAAAFVIPVLSVNKGVLLAAKVAVGMIISAISGKFRNFKEYVFCYCLFILYTFIFGGAVVAFSFLLGAKYDILTGFGDGRLPVGFCVLCSIVLYYSINAVVRKIYVRKTNYNFSAEVSVCFGGESFHLKGFIDSGNGLRYKKSGCPVVICSAEAFRRKFFNTDMNKFYVGDITAKTVAGETKIKVYKPDRMVIYAGTRPNIIYNVMMGVSSSPFTAQNEFDLLLSPILA